MVQINIFKIMSTDCFKNASREFVRTVNTRNVEYKWILIIGKKYNHMPQSLGRYSLRNIYRSNFRITWM